MQQRVRGGVCRFSHSVCRWWLRFRRRLLLNDCGLGMYEDGITRSHATVYC